ncbi:phospholipase D-like domain-containing protein [Aurantimonas sp. A2-1-M11]|uniref:phospholipase D-like domain-containing protein n=1 Tax=Aurantimonas sp. A2-1-M11 TaxID=3113712 RepID=UPI002F939B42
MNPLVIDRQTDDWFWRRERADRMAVIIDAADFFKAAKDAMLQARHSILLIGWDFDARIELEPKGKTLAGPNAVGPFLTWLGKRRPALDIRILKWDAGAVYSIGRGETPLTMLRWKLSGPVEMRLDGVHPPLSTHHMKLLVIDEAIAFCGGIDMTTGRWDTREHAENDPARVSPRKTPLGPWHDATTCMTGPAAKALSDLARSRWAHATGEMLGPFAGDFDIWPSDVTADFETIDVSICRTLPEHLERPQANEIERATLAMIAKARRRLYIESQYFASRRIADAIAERLAEPDGPEIVVINPDTADGWLEAQFMDSSRIRMMGVAREADHNDRFRLVYPVNEAGTPIYVHAKIMIADEQLLKIGSANLNNRSMGFDSECDVVVDADGDPQAEARIAHIRDDLLAEHLGLSEDEVRDALADGGSMIALVDASAQKQYGRRLLPLPMRELTPDEEMMAESDLADPLRPRKLARAFHKLFG